MNGGIKFFEFINPPTTRIAGSSNEILLNNILLYDKKKVWRSLGSANGKKEEIQIFFKEAITFDRLFLINHNWSDFKIYFTVNEQEVILQNVTTINNIKCSLDISNYEHSTAYFEFDSIVVTALRIEIFKTKGDDKEKHLGHIVLTNQLGELEGYPVLETEFDSGIIKQCMLSRRYRIYRKDDIFQAKLHFKNYPSKFQRDLKLIYQINSLSSFYLWACGGRIGKEFYSFPLRGYKAEDLFKCMVSADVTESFSSNIFVNNVNISLAISEVV
ncbi:MAG: hypothetical protein HQK51_19120 [Oligoflexia bacterium]|nr:hypothetical protein [Oligoflexia bacterium]